MPPKLPKDWKSRPLLWWQRRAAFRAATAQKARTVAQRLSRNVWTTARRVARQARITARRVARQARITARRVARQARITARRVARKARTTARRLAARWRAWAPEQVVRAFWRAWTAAVRPRPPAEARPRTPFDALRGWIPADRCLRDPGEIAVYECDGLPLHKRPPTAVVICLSEEDVVRTVRWCNEHSIPFVPRGAGTGLSGGATPVRGGVILDCNRMNRILEIDLENRFARVQPGVINIRLSQATQDAGLLYAPDPSSQMACTIGGNVAENSGGPHCLKYGMTTDHVLGLRVVLPDGSVATLGGAAVESPGYDLTGLFVGTEGTFGVVVEATVRLLPTPPAVRTFLAIFDSMGNACRMVARITRDGILPAALEILDRNTIVAVEASVYAAGYPEDAAAVLLVELDGLDGSLDEDEARIKAIAAECCALEFRTARDARERVNLWKGRKGAFGAMGRINTDLYVLDGVVPRTQLESVLERVDEIAQRHQVTLSNVFHAGDGNLHPNISYDGRDEDEKERVLAAGREILELCVAVGGSISGEHGVGLEKSEFLPLCFDPDDIRTMIDVRHAVDPHELSNPEKIFPDSRTCNEAGRRRFMKIPMSDEEARIGVTTP